MSTERSQIEQLARLYRVETSFVDTWKRRRTVSDAALIDTCRLLGAPLDSASDVPDALCHRRRELQQRLLEPVNVAWEGAAALVPLRIPPADREAKFHWRLELEDGLAWETSGSVSQLSEIGREDRDEAEYTLVELVLPENLPRGYHRLQLEMNARRAESLIIVAPQRAYAFSESTNHHRWGAFLPLYSLHRSGSPHTGTYSDLADLMLWIAERGGSFVATLPLLATLWELGDDPSPYQPATRLFWNEFYLDLKQLPEFRESPRARAFESQKASKSELVDYVSEMQQKREALEEMAAAFYQKDTSARRELDRQRALDPELDLFAQFRAVGERQKGAWLSWPERLQRGDIRPDDYDESIYQCHLYTQWQVRQQLAAIKDQGEQQNLLWYLDYPVGVNAGGYDVWRNPELFVRDADGGAPPDDFFTKGQSWGFPPVHPERMRAQGYAYFIQALRAHLQHAKVLRLDHIMGLYRFYWIPRGHGADDGAYVRYPLDEMFAILSLESHRYGARIIGENLGTVPDEVNEALTRFNVDGMYVLQFETNAGGPGPAIRPVATNMAASLNTHDTPPFAAFWEGSEIEDRVQLGLMTPGEARAEQAQRAELRARVIEFLQGRDLLDSAQPGTQDVLAACLKLLARSDAEFVVVSLEDLWGETKPQNRPGTHTDQPNWRRRAARSFDEFRDEPAVQEVLSTIAVLREQRQTA